MIRIEACGDRSLLIYLGDQIDPELNARVHSLASRLRAAGHPAVREVSPGYSTVLFEYDPLLVESESELLRLVEAAAAGEERPRQGREVMLPVLYGGEMGPDLGFVAEQTGLAAGDVIRRHAGGAYRVYCLGFSPGFCYLGGLDPGLHVPRRTSPRTRVPAGSVAIGGAQTGAYPTPSPAGWHLIGRTPLPLFDAGRRASPAVAEPGDTIRFHPVDAAEYERLAGLYPPRNRRLPTWQAGRPGIRILRPGLFTTVQDRGRSGYQAYGVPVAGAADPWALTVGNWLVGNPGGAAALEMTLLGAEVEFTGVTAFVLAGATMDARVVRADGASLQPVEGWRVYVAGPGDRLLLGPSTAGCRTYLCVAGSFDLEQELGSLSEDLLGGIGPVGRALQPGDWLPTGLPLLPPADLAGRSLPSDLRPRFGHEMVVRVTPGPQERAFTSAGIDRFYRSRYLVTHRSDRQGVRMSGPAVGHAGGADILSEGMPAGGIQVPPSGEPILMLANRATMGGYTKIAVAVYPDTVRAGQLRPGDGVRFAQIDLAEAHRIAREEARALAEVRTTLRPPSQRVPVIQRARQFRVSVDGVAYLVELEEI